MPERVLEMQRTYSNFGVLSRFVLARVKDGDAKVSLFCTVSSALGVDLITTSDTGLRWWSSDLRQNDETGYGTGESRLKTEMVGKSLSNAPVKGVESIH